MALTKRQYVDGQTIITAANLNDIQDHLIDVENSYVPKTRTVAGKALSSNITLAASDVGAVPTSRTINSKALTGNITLSAADVGAVPVARTVNSKALSSNITLNAADVGAVPTTRTVNSKALSSNITLSAADVGAVPTSRTVNGKALSSNVTLAAADISYGSSDVDTTLDNLNDALSNINFGDVQSVTTASTNLNNYTDGGIWFFGSSYTPTNKPTGTGNYGFLIVLKGSSNQRLAQYWIDSAASANAMWMRTNSSSTVSWSSWKRLATDADITPIQAMFVPTTIPVTVVSGEDLPSGVTAVSVSVVQAGNLVQVIFGITRDTVAVPSIGNYASVATGLPIPKATLVFDGASVPNAQVRVYAQEHTGRFLNCMVNSSGVLRINRGETSGNYIGQFVYLTDDYSHL